MTDLAVALANPPGVLTGFEGLNVVRAAVELPNAGGGLHESLQFEPVELHHGDEGYLVIHYKVRKVRFDPPARRRTRRPLPDVRGGRSR